MNQNLTKSTNFLLYTTPDGEIKVDVLLQNETLWLSQKSMAALFACSIDNISLHLKNIFKSKELEEKSVVEDFSTTANDGKAYRVKHYNLDAIISVGYRINSLRGTQFRIWATKQLKEFIIKGFVMDDERLKNPLSLSLKKRYSSSPIRFIFHDAHQLHCKRPRKTIGFQLLPTCSQLLQPRHGA